MPTPTARSLLTAAGLAAAATPVPTDGPSGGQHPLSHQFRRMPPLLRRSDLLARGRTEGELRRARDEGSIIALGPGVYMDATEWRRLDGAGRYLAALAGIVGGLSGDPVVSHWSAAVLHAIIEVPPGRPRVDITRAAPWKSRQGAAVRFHRGTLDRADVVAAGTLQVTSAARTVLDCAVTLPIGPATALIRRALTGGSVTAAELRDGLRRLPRMPGVRTVGTALDAIAGGQPPVTARR